jgi:hypothetical protein
MDRACTFCAAKRIVARLLEGQAHLDPLKARLLDQIDRGHYNRHVLQKSYQMGKALRALAELKEAPSHVWLDGLSIQRREREAFRKELIEAGLLGIRPAVVKGRVLRPRVSSIACSHRSRSCCRPCHAERLIRAAFQDFPLLQPLQDRYIAQLRSGYYHRDFFHNPETPLWRYIEELGARKQLPENGYLDAQYPTPVLRSLRKELNACGLLKPIEEHPEVRRFELWSKRVLDASELDSDAKRIVDRYRKLRMMSYARRHLNQRSDNGYAVRDALHRDVRLIISFVVLLKGRDRTLYDFDITDAQVLPAKTLALLRPFLIWLRHNKISSTPWVPKSIRSNTVFRGVGVAALRLATERMLNDTSVPLCDRVLAILSFFGFTLPKLSPIRASDVLEGDQIMVAGSAYDLEPTVAELVRVLRDNLLLEVAASRPAGWDPWLFGPADAIEQPDPIGLYRRLQREGFRTRALRNESARLGAANPTVCLVTQEALGRTRVTASKQLSAFSSRAGSYAVMLADARLEPELEI